MGENASLDDFLGGESSGQSEAADATADTEPADGAVDDGSTDAATDAEPADATADAGAADDPDVDTEQDVEPAATTYAWDDAGAACDDCGETVERRWQQEGGLVCIACKDWERA